MLRRTTVKSRGKITVRTSDWKTSLWQGCSLGNSSAGQNLSWCWPTPHLVCLPYDCYSSDCCQLCWEILQCAQFTDENDELDGDITNLIYILINYMRGKNNSIYPMSVLICHQYPTSGLAVGWGVLWENLYHVGKCTIILAFELYTRVICCTTSFAELPHTVLTSSW